MVAHERAVARGEGRLLHGAAEPADQVAGEVLQRGEAGPGAVVRRRRPAADPLQPVEHVVELVVGGVGGVPRAHRLPDRRAVEPGEVDLAGDGAVLDVVHGVGDVVGEVHDLRLDAAAPAVRSTASRIQSKAGRSSSYTPNLAPSRVMPSLCTPPGTGASAIGQGYFVQASSVARVRLRPTEAPAASDVFASSRVSRRSVCALPSNPPQSAREPVERALAVVPERRVSEVVRERRGLGDVGVGAERAGEVARDLGDLEAVGQPVADEVVALRADHLGLGREPAERRGVDDARAVALERLALRRVDPLRRLRHDPLAVGVAVPLLDDLHRRDTTVRRRP